MSVSIPFATIDWSGVPVTQHPGEQGMAYWRAHAVRREIIHRGWRVFRNQNVIRPKMITTKGRYKPSLKELNMLT
jgi:hypothetical protein